MPRTMKEKKVIRTWSSDQLSTDNDIDEAFKTIYRNVDTIMSVAKVAPGNLHTPNFFNSIKESTKLARKNEKKPYLKLGIIDEDLCIRAKIGIDKVPKNQDHIDDFIAASAPEFEKISVSRLKEVID